jgi:hypothetical protein
VTQKGRPRLISPGEAKSSLASKLASRVDRLRQIDTRLGFRPYQVYLVWTKWDGDERGDGDQRVVCRAPLLPNPMVQSLDALNKVSSGAGRYPAGTVRVTEVSATYTLEMLTGKVLPDRPEDQIPEPYQFFFEVVEDGRHGCEPDRKRFALAAEPHLDAGNFQWILVLQIMNGAMARDGNPVPAPVVPPVDPWQTRKLDAPDDDF